MLTVHPLYSSSSGNMFHIASSSANILIDVGVSYKAINEGLKSIGLTINEIDAIFITHEHSDHIKGLPLLCRKNTDKPIYAVGKTANYLIESLTQKNIQCNILPIFCRLLFRHSICFLPEQVRCILCRPWAQAGSAGWCHPIHIR